MLTSVQTLLGPAVTAVVGATVICTLAFMIPGVPEVKAEPQIKVAAATVPVKGDRLPMSVKGAACSLLGWPNYEPRCQFDTRRSAVEMPTIRIIALR